MEETIVPGENKKYHADGTVSISDRKIVEREKIDIPNTPKHNHSLTWFGRGTSITKVAVLN